MILVCLFNKYLRAYHVSSTLLETWNTVINRTNPLPPQKTPKKNTHKENLFSWDLNSSEERQCTSNKLLNKII